MSKLAFAAAIMFTASATVASAETWTVSTWDPPYDFSNPPKEIEYQGLDAVSKQWNLCVVFPHFKGPYWGAVNYGVVEQAKKLGLKADIVDAGGAKNLDKQIELVKNCAADGGYDAIILAPVSFSEMTPTVVEASAKLPVFALSTQMQGDGLSGMVAVSWEDMGRVAGRYFQEKHPAGSDPVKVAWLPGPEGKGWVTFTDTGFREEIKNSSVELVTVKFGDIDRNRQKTLVEEALDEVPDVDYIAGNAVAIEAAMGVLPQRGLKDKVKLVADYFTPAMYRGVRRDIVTAVPTDSAALQGMLSVDMAVRHLEGSSIATHVGPAIFNVDKDSVKTFNPDESLAPSGFTPVFKVP